MKYILFSVAIIVLLVSCSPKSDPAEKRMKQKIIMNQMLDNDEVSMVIEENGSISTRESVVLILKKTKELMSFRAHYNAHQDIPSLVGYADSILARYQSLKPKDDRLISGSKQYRQSVIDAADSTSMLNLTWYTLYAESAILRDYSLHVYGGFRFFPLFPTNVSDSVVALGDTVFVHVAGVRELENWNVDFGSVACKNEQTGNSIPPRVIKTGVHYILRFIPNEKGKYRLHGPIYISQGPVREDYPIANEFVVE
jgi:hypothetical protein